MSNSFRDFFQFNEIEKDIRSVVPLEVRGEAQEAIFVSAGVVFFPDRPRVGTNGWLNYDYLIELQRGPIASISRFLSYAQSALLPVKDDPHASSFRRYYDAFLQNSLRGRRYRIRLATGEIADGVPTSGSMVDVRQTNPTFSFRTDVGALYRFPFNVLVDAVPIDAEAAFLRERLRVAGSRDLLVQIPKDNAECLRGVDHSIVLVNANWGSSNVAPTHLYKFLTIQAAEYEIKEILPLAQRVLQLVVSPTEGDGPWG
jgi:hypothetical protein